MQKTMKKIPAKIWRLVKRPFLTLRLAEVLTQVRPPVPSIAWSKPTRTPLKFTLQHRKSLHPLTYQLDILQDATRYIDFRGKTILEIGGSNLPRELVFSVLGAKKWICVDLLGWLEGNRKDALKTSERIVYPLNHPDSKQIIRDNDYVVFDGSATEIGKELHDEFDACVSICSFEHIHELHKAVDGIYHSLKNLGTLYTPIWSGDVGHHFWIDEKYNFTRSRECHLPPYAHLLYSASEIDELLSPYYVTAEEIQTKNKIVKQCTDETLSNRLFYEDFFQIMKSSQFQNISVTPYWTSQVDVTTWLQLCRLYPNYNAFSVNGVQIVAQK
jgi:SAM-dependent methyltransferase